MQSRRGFALLGLARGFEALLLGPVPPSQPPAPQPPLVSVEALEQGLRGLVSRVATAASRTKQHRLASLATLGAKIDNIITTLDHRPSPPPPPPAAADALPGLLQAELASRVHDGSQWAGMLAGAREAVARARAADASLGSFEERWLERSEATWSLATRLVTGGCGDLVSYQSRSITAGGASAIVYRLFMQLDAVQLSLFNSAVWGEQLAAAKPHHQSQGRNIPVFLSVFGKEVQGSSGHRSKKLRDDASPPALNLAPRLAQMHVLTAETVYEGFALPLKQLISATRQHDLAATHPEKSVAPAWAKESWRSRAIADTVLLAEVPTVDSEDGGIWMERNNPPRATLSSDNIFGKLKYDAPSMQMRTAVMNCMIREEARLALSHQHHRFHITMLTAAQAEQAVSLRDMTFDMGLITDPSTGDARAGTNKSSPHLWCAAPTTPPCPSSSPTSLPVHTTRLSHASILLCLQLGEQEGARHLERPDCFQGKGARLPQLAPRPALCRRATATTADSIPIARAGGLRHTGALDRAGRQRRPHEAHGRSVLAPRQGVRVSGLPPRARRRRRAHHPGRVPLPRRARGGPRAPQVARRGGPLGKGHRRVRDVQKGPPARPQVAATRAAAAAKAAHAPMGVRRPRPRMSVCARSASRRRLDGIGRAPDTRLGRVCAISVARKGSRVGGLALGRA